MSDDLKDELVKLGESNPELRDHLRPVIDRIATVKTAAKTGKCSLGGTPTFIKMEGMDELERVISGVCDLSSMEMFISPGMSYIDVYVSWPSKISRDDYDAKKQELESMIKTTNLGRQMSRSGVHVHLQGASFTLNM